MIFTRCRRQAQGTAGAGSLALVQAVLGAIPGFYTTGLLVLSCLCSRHGTNASRQSILLLTRLRHITESKISRLQQQLDSDFKGERVNKTERRASSEATIRDEEENIRSIDECIQQHVRNKQKERK